jgi:hypothetical protein
MPGGTLSGQLFYIFAIAILDAAILSWVALHWYRRTVAQRMRRNPGPQTHSSTVEAPQPLPRFDVSPKAHQPLQIAVFHADQSTGAKPSRDWPEGWRRIAVAYCVGAALFSTVISAAAVSELPSVRPTAVFAMWWMNAWPVVPTLIALLLLDRRSGIRLVAAYVLCGSATLAALTLVVQVWQGSFNSAPLTNIFWLNAGIIATAWLPLTLVMISGLHRIRGVMPLSLASTLFFGFGLLFFREGITRSFNSPSFRDVLLSLAVLTSSQFAYYSLYMLLALPAGWLAWRFLKTLAVGFERKRFSDVQLVVDCWWVIVTAERIAGHLVATFGLPGIAIGGAAFAAYRLGTSATLRLVRQEPADRPKRLLLLRVFGYQARTESLFDRIAQRWRFRGPVQLIAGVDLAMRTADPGDILAFVGGRLREVYVSSLEELPERLQRLDVGRDPDGRFRVNDLYCVDGTWRETLQQLLPLSDVVVMDLRGFSTMNSGCMFELEQLVAQLPTEAIVLVCDNTTDLKLLARLLDHAWVRAEAVRTTRPVGPISLVRIERNSLVELNTLMDRLLGCGTPRQVLSVADL